MALKNARAYFFFDLFIVAIVRILAFYFNWCLRVAEDDAFVFASKEYRWMKFYSKDAEMKYWRKRGRRDVPNKC